MGRLRSKIVNQPLVTGPRNNTIVTPIDIRLREATLEDAPSLATLCAQLGYAVILTEIVERMPQFIAAEDSWIAVAVDGNRVLGWMQTQESRSLVDGWSAQIIGLVVDERFRREGIGRALVEGACAWARERGYAEISVRSNAARKGAHDFYPSLGFKLKKTQRCYRKPLG